MSSGIEEMEVELNTGGMQECAGFSLCIGKISQGLRKFRNPCEILLCTVFRYDSEISLS